MKSFQRLLESYKHCIIEHRIFASQNQHGLTLIRLKRPRSIIRWLKYICTTPDHAEDVNQNSSQGSLKEDSGAEVGDESRSQP